MSERTNAHASRAATVLDSQEHAEVLYVFGELDLSQATDFEATVMGAAVPGKKFVIDLSECRYIDSTIVTALIRARRNLGDTFSLVVVPGGSVDRMFHILELHHQLGITPGSADGVSAGFSAIP